MINNVRRNFDGELIWRHVKKELMTRRAIREGELGEDAVGGV
jgi:hypothetical protein